MWTNITHGEQNVFPAAQSARPYYDAAHYRTTRMSPFAALHKSEKTTNYYLAMEQSDTIVLYHNTAARLHWTLLWISRHSTRTYSTLKKEDPRYIDEFIQVSDFIKTPIARTQINRRISKWCVENESSNAGAVLRQIETVRNGYERPGKIQRNPLRSIFAKCVRYHPHCVCTINQYTPHCFPLYVSTCVEHVFGQLRSSSDNFYHHYCPGNSIFHSIVRRQLWRQFVELMCHVRQTVTIRATTNLHSQKTIRKDVNIS